MPLLTKSGAQFQKSLARVIGFPTFVLLVLAGILVAQILSLLSLAAWVDHTDQVIAQTVSTQKLMLDQQTGRRGYLIGGDQKFLEPASRAAPQIGPAFDKLNRLVSDNAQQTRRLGMLRQTYTRWNQNSQFEMSLYKRSPELARAYFNRGHGKSLMDDLRAQFAAFLSTEEGLRTARQAEAHRANRQTLIGLTVLAAVTGVLLGIVLVRQMRRVAAQYEDALTASHKGAALLSATLQSIGDAVLVTDAAGCITDMNPVAEELTGWLLSDAQGRAAKEIFEIVGETTRQPVESPIEQVLRDGVAAGLARHTVLLRRDGAEVPIDDSAAPIRSETGEISGTVLVFRDISERRRTERDRAALYEREHSIAENLQRSLLTRPPSESLGGLTVETLYRPAWGEAQVGGDFYDIIVLEEGKVALVVGDISGKGLAAASRTSEAKYTLRAYLREYSHAAAALMRLNSFLCEAQMLSGDSAEYFLCLTLAVISPATGRMEIAVAGMEPPLILSPEGQVTEIPVEGMPLGIVPKAEYEAEQRVLPAGHRLIFATDGITEAQQGHEMLGNQGMSLIAAKSLPEDSLRAVGEAILAGAEAYSGGQFRDDVCLLLAERPLL